MKNERRNFRKLCALLAVVALGLLFALLAGAGAGGTNAFADDLPEDAATPTPWAEPTSWVVVSPTFIAIVEIPTETPIPPPLPPSPPTATLPPEPIPPTPTEFVAPAATVAPTATLDTAPSPITIPTYGWGIIPLPTPQEPGPVYLPENSPTPIVVLPASTPTSRPIPPSPTLTVTSTTGPVWFPPGPECAPKPGKTLLKLDVPYIHQVNDVTGADGNWACGPTSVLMALAYYGKVEPWPQYQQEQAGKVTPKPTRTTQATATRTPTRTATSAPTPKRPQPTRPAQTTLDAKLAYGPYLTEPFTYGGHTFSATAPDPRGDRVAGLYGTIAPTGLADWGRMAQVFAWYGLSSRQISPTWDNVVAALKRGHPVLLGNDLTAAGHILVAIGYTANKHLIVNDPYGNRFTWGYGANDGEGVYYPWGCSRVRNALEVIGVYTPPSTPATSTAVPAPVAEALPEHSAAPDVASGTVGRRESSAPHKNSLLSFAARAIGSNAPVLSERIVPTADHAAANRQAAHSSNAPIPALAPAGASRVLLADRSSAGPAYWWLTLPTLVAFTGFMVLLGEWRTRKRPSWTKARRKFD